MPAAFVTGATGFLGRHLVPELAARGFAVRALVRAGSASRLPRGAAPVVGDALDRRTYQAEIEPGSTFVHLVGVAHPGPSKAAEFRSIDLRSAEEAALAARDARVRHFVYLSVAQPAPVMRAYLEARAAGERAIRAAFLDASFVRPWYVLGPGRRWPLVLAPMIWLLERLPPTRDTARRLGFVTVGAMTRALAWCAEHPPEGVRIVDVPRIRELGRGA